MTNPGAPSKADPKRRILFVDDDQNLLHGLRRMLRSMRDDWEMDFVSSGCEALARLEQAAFDVVVSDVRMPQMDGVQLLKEVQTRWPKTVRIFLSGQSDLEKTKNAVTVAHQYLAKPCDAEILKAVVARACALGGLLMEERLRQLASRIDSIPSIPSVYRELTEEVQRQDVPVQKIGAIISKDIGMTAKILKVVNSAFFGAPRAISDPAQAVVFLGLETLKSLVLSCGLFESLTESGHSALSFDEVWAHSLATAEGAKKIARSVEADSRVVEEAFTAGMLHDAGMVVLAAKLPEQYRQTVEKASTDGMSLQEAEKAALGAHHGAVGAYVLGLWGLSPSVIEAVAFHHHPNEALHQGFDALTAVHVADVLSRSECPGKLYSHEEGLDREYLAALGLVNQIETWRGLLQSDASNERAGDG